MFGEELKRGFRYRSNEEILEAMREFYEKYGKVPHAKEISQFSKEFPPMSLLRKRFGSYREALFLAGLTQKRRRKRGRWNEEELLEFIWKFFDENGKAPTMMDFYIDPDLPSTHTYLYYFGSWNEAIRRAGLKVNYREYSDEELLKMLADFCAKFKGIPKTLDVDADEDMPCAAIYGKRFGSWSKALELVGLTPQKRTYTDDELLAFLVDFYHENDRFPIGPEVDRDENMPSEATYWRRFGSFEKALERARVMLWREKLEWQKE